MQRGNVVEREDADKNRGESSVGILEQHWNWQNGCCSWNQIEPSFPERVRKQPLVHSFLNVLETNAAKFLPALFDVFIVDLSLFGIMKISHLKQQNKTNFKKWTKDRFDALGISGMAKNMKIFHEVNKKLSHRHLKKQRAGKGRDSNL